jgi:hypothetical protein
MLKKIEEIKTAGGAESGLQTTSSAAERSEIYGLPYSASSSLQARLRGSQLFSTRFNILFS